MGKPADQFSVMLADSGLNDQVDIGVPFSLLAPSVDFTFSCW